MEYSGSAPNLTRDVIGDLQTELDDPTAPFTTVAVADQLECTESTFSLTHPASDE